MVEGGSRCRGSMPGRGHYGEDLTYFSRRDNMEANKELEGTSTVDAEEVLIGVADSGMGSAALP